MIDFTSHLNRAWICFAFITISNAMFAQEETRRTSDLSGITKNVIIGYAYSDFAITPNDHIKTNFTRVGFSPTMIWKLGDKLFFESQIEFYTDSHLVITQVEYAKLSYVLNKHVTIGMGKILTPFGTYTERFEAPFIERMPNAPIGFRHKDGWPNTGPVGSEMGLDIRGGMHVGDAKMNYVIYFSNGAKLHDGTTEPKLAGAVEYENFFDNNSNKAVGWRLGYLPLSNSSLEIGVSSNYSIAGTVNTKYENVAATAYAFDLSYHKSFPKLKTIVNLKGQLNYLHVDDADYLDEGGLNYTFKNESYIYYTRLSLRPAYLHNKFIKRTEFLVRYNYASLAKDAHWGGTTTRTDVGIAYWLSVRTGLRIAYEITEYPGNHKEEVILMRFVTGF